MKISDSGYDGHTKNQIRYSTTSFFLEKEKDGDRLFDLSYLPKTTIYREGIVRTGQKVYSMAVTQLEGEDM